MADFHQSGLIATLHKLGNATLEKIEAELSWYSQERPIALVLPSLYSELEGQALKRIIAELKKVKYLKEVVVTLGPCTKEEFNRAKEFFSVLPQTTKLIPSAWRYREGTVSLDSIRLYYRSKKYKRYLTP
jgi:glucosyl-3-phosphoglycerate synthase